MPNYQNGKVYQITSYQTTDVYIGSTTQSLSLRMCGHRSDHKKHISGKGMYCSSFILLQYDDAKIELIEDCPCDNKEQLGRREGQLIRERSCVNKVIPGRTDKEYREDNRETIIEKHNQYNQANKEKARQYRQANRETIIEKRNQYNQANKEKARQYRQANKEKISQRKKEQYALKKSNRLNEKTH